MTLENTVKKYRELFKSKPPVTTAHTEKGHFYINPGTEEKYHSVTYFTNFIKDPSLANWKMNRALDVVDKQFVCLDGDKFILHSPALRSWKEFLDYCKSAPEGEFQNAGDIGTQTHAWRQAYFQRWIDQGWISLTDQEIDDWKFPVNADPEVISGCRAIKWFLKETGYIPVACELPLVDDELKVGGTIDDLGVFPNPIKVPLLKEGALYGEYTEQDAWMKDGYKIKYFPYLGFVDLKTSNQGKKPAYAYQVRGFYQRMIRKTFGVKPKKTYILHTSKDDGTYKLIDLTEMKHLQKDAEDLVRLSRSWDKVGEAFKPKQIVI